MAHALSAPQPCDWSYCTFKLAQRYAERFMRRIDLPPNFYPRTDVALSNFSIVPFIAISTLANSPT